MTDLVTLLTILGALLVGAVSPGPSFVFVVRTAVAQSRREGLAAALGMGVGACLYGALAAVISKQFFAGVNDTTAFIFALMAFAAGFVVRPFGALFFGRLGDMVGRKHTFLVTILIMGLSTFIIGLLPTYDAIGVAAPILLIALRMLQGLALGGEYGGAATYVAEHAPPNQRAAVRTAWERRLLNVLNTFEYDLVLLSGFMRVLSAEFRNERMMRAEEKAARLPAIMTVPLFLFILPVLFVVILGPAACSIADAFASKPGGPK